MSTQNQPYAIDFLCLTSEEWGEGKVTRPLPKGEIAFEVASEKIIYILKGDGYPPNAGELSNDYTRLRIDFFEYQFRLDDNTKTIKEWIHSLIEEDAHLESLIRESAEALEEEAEKRNNADKAIVQKLKHEKTERELFDELLLQGILAEKQSLNIEKSERQEADRNEEQKREQDDIRIHKRITQIKDEERFLYNLNIETSGEFLLLTDADGRNEYPYHHERRLDADKFCLREIDNLTVFDLEKEFVKKEEWKILDDLVMSSAGEYLVAIDITQARTQAGEYDLRILDKAPGYKIEYRDYDRDKDAVPFDVMRYGDFTWQPLPAV